MKTAYAATAALALALLTGIVGPPSHAHADVSFDVMVSNLSPHGSWLVSAQYGRVWQPRVYAPGWNPYYDGHWVYTDLGWSWVSDYDWGAIPYHYGTWALDPVVGWVWIPGTTWAPSWVVFRTGPEAIGWAPVAPSFAVGVSFGSAVPAPGSFVFVSAHDFAAPRIRPCVAPEARARVLVRNTTVVNTLVVQNDIVVNRGPDVRVVGRASGRPIRAASIETVPRVAPFAGVRRAQLVVAPDRAAHGVRAAEPISPKHALPSTGDRASVTEGHAPHVEHQQAPPQVERHPPQTPHVERQQAPPHAERQAAPAPQAE